MGSKKDKGAAQALLGEPTVESDSKRSLLEKNQILAPPAPLNSKPSAPPNEPLIKNGAPPAAPRKRERRQRRQEKSKGSKVIWPLLALVALGLIVTAIILLVTN